MEQIIERLFTDPVFVSIGIVLAVLISLSLLKKLVKVVVFLVLILLIYGYFIYSTGAEVVVTSNPGCLLQIQSGLKKTGSKIRVMHIADFLATGISATPSD